MGVPSSASRFDRLAADDALQLAVDHGLVPMAIGALLVLDPSHPPSASVVRAALLEGAATVPRLSQRLLRPGPGAGRQVWVDAGPAVPGDRVDDAVVTIDDQDVSGGVPRALLAAAADLILEPLDRELPLWRVRLLLDRRGGVRAVAVVAHHLLADGMGGLALLAALAGGTSHRHPRPPAGEPPQGTPPWHALATDAWRLRLQGLQDLRGLRRGLGHVVEGVKELGGGRPQLAAPCSLLGATGRRRTLELATVDLGPLHAAAHGRGASVNEVVVTAVTGALVRLLERRGEEVDELVVSVPVSRRAQGRAGALGNATGVVPVAVPGVADVATRLRALVEQRPRLRAPGRGGSAAVLTPLFRGMAAVGAFQWFIAHQRLVHTFVTNVRGPADRLRVAGTPVVALVPLAVNPGNVAVSFDVLSYAGTLSVTLVSDPDLVPEVRWLAQAVAEELERFAAEVAAPARRPGRAPA